jgi:hypothetical protein
MLVKDGGGGALCYKLEGRGFESRRGALFLIDLILPATL